MNLSQLDGFQRVKPTPVELNGKGKSRRKLKRAQRRAQRKGTNKRAPMKTVADVQSRQPTQARATSAKKNVQSSGAMTKRARKEAKMKKYSSINGDKNKNSDPSVGFSRQYVSNEPTTNLDESSLNGGFSRITYSSKELQGLSLQGVTILQGYALGDSDDLEDWNYLLSIEHPDTLQGFPSWVLNGKGKRKARQAKRKARREKRSTKKAVRTAKKSARRERGQRRKEVRTAKKEERLLKKQQRREQRGIRKEERRSRQQQRLDDRKERQRQRQETRRLKAELKAKAREEGGGIFENLSEGAFDIAKDLVRGGGDFQDFSYQDFTPDEFPGNFEEIIDTYREMPSEDVLTERDKDLELMDDTIGEFELDKPEKKSGGGLLIPLLIGGAVLMGTQKKGKKKKR